MCPKTDRRDMRVFPWLEAFPYQMGFSIEQKEDLKKKKKRIYLTFFVSQHIFSFLSFLCCIIYLAMWFPSSHSSLSVLFKVHLEVSSSSPRNQTGMQRIHPFRGLSQNITHHYCHSLFQSCCYILKTLRADVVLIPDYSPAQFIKQGQTPLHSLYIKFILNYL